MNEENALATPPSTNDHIVPRMYLRRFAVERSGGPQICASNIDTPTDGFATNTRNIAAEKGFYWGTGPNGIPTHDMEAFLTGVEGSATSAFRTLLDKGRLPSENALPDRWPPRPQTRAAVSWWLAAQLIRTAPQRERLWRLHGDATLEPPRSMRRADLHHAYIVHAVAPLAALIHARPWGFGFTGLCLLTSDSPVQVFNAKTDDDPLATATFWDIYVPLDPHRFLYLPGQMHSKNRALMRDHRINLPSGLAIALNIEVIETAHRHIIWHPNHDPRGQLNLEEALTMRRSRQNGNGGTVLNYTAIDGDFGVERRWLDVHTWDVGEPDSADDERGSEVDPITMIESLTAQLTEAQEDFAIRRGE